MEGLALNILVFCAILFSLVTLCLLSLYLILSKLPLEELKTLLQARISLEQQENPLLHEGEPIPEKLLNFILNESEHWAVDGRILRARELFREVEDWDIVEGLIYGEDGFSADEVSDIGWGEFNEDAN
jgi:hypothetical protein